MQIAPDLTEEERADIASLALRLRIDGLVVSNTTIGRPPAVLAQQHGREVGGLLPSHSLHDRTTKVFYSTSSERLVMLMC